MDFRLVQPTSCHATGRSFYAGAYSLLSLNTGRLLCPQDPIFTACIYSVQPHVCSLCLCVLPRALCVLLQPGVFSLNTLQWCLLHTACMWSRQCAIGTALCVVATAYVCSLRSVHFLKSMCAPYSLGVLRQPLCVSAQPMSVLHTTIHVLPVPCVLPTTCVWSIQLVCAPYSPCMCSLKHRV